MYRLLITLGLVASLIGCTAQPTKQLPVTYQKFSAPLEKKLQAETGDDLFVEGAYIKGEKILLTQDYSLMIPGSMMIPFPVYIGAGELALSRITPNWKYYCGRPETVTATFPGLGSVIANGDCVGVRISNDNTAKKEWVVDNSIYNRMNTIWSRSIAASDAVSIIPKESKIPFDVRTLKRITFDGHYGGQLHFTWQEVAPGLQDSRDFTFDFNGKPTLVGIKGNVFKIHKADNLHLTYEWVKIATN